MNGQREIWPQVVEKAYGQDIGGFSPDGGYVVDALDALTGKKAVFQPTSNVTLKELKTLSNEKALMVFGCLGSGTQDSPGPYNLIGQHAHMFDGSTYKTGQTLVNLINPWGDIQPDPVPFSQLAANLSEFDHGTI